MGKSNKKQSFCELSPDMSDGELRAYVKSVKAPRFVCGKCCRLSSRKRNLCHPRKLTKQQAGA